MIALYWNKKAAFSDFILFAFFAVAIVVVGCDNTIILLKRKHIATSYLVVFFLASTVTSVCVSAAVANNTTATTATASNSASDYVATPNLFFNATHCILIVLPFITGFFDVCSYLCCIVVDGLLQTFVIANIVRLHSM